MRTPSPIAYLRLVIGSFFAIVGVLAVIGLQHESISVGQDISGVQIVFGIIEILGGLALILGVFTSFRITPVYVLSIILFWVWVLKIVLNILSLIFPSFPSDSGVSVDVGGWFVSFALQAIVLAALYVTNRDYDIL